MTARRFPSYAVHRRRLLAAGLLALLAILSGIALFWTAQRVQMGEAQLHHLQAGAVDEAESLRVLRAEWDYLNRPDRLEALARTKLGMGPAHAGAVGIPGAPLTPATPPAVPAPHRVIVRTEPLHPATTSAPAAAASSATPAPDARNFHDLLRSLAHDDAGTGKSGPP